MFSTACIHRISMNRFGLSTFVSEHPRPPLSLELGGVYKGHFQLHIEMLNVDNREKVMHFVQNLLMSLGVSRHSRLTASQANELNRLSKILDRVDDVANFAGERQNAARLLQSCLHRLEWDEDSLQTGMG